MYDNFNYPLGADTQDAPWNEPRPESRQFDCLVTEILSKHVIVNTCDYCLDEGEDEDGYYTSVITSETDWNKAYNDDGHYTILELLNKLKEYVEEDIANSDNKDYTKQRHLKGLLSELQEWTCEESKVNLE